MGQAQSDGNGGAQTPFDIIPPQDRHGWKVMQVMPNSPSSGLGICPYFSVLTHVNGVRLGKNDSDLIPLIKENQHTQLTFLNLSTLSVRNVEVTPRRGWGGEGLLGLMIRHDYFENAHMECVHILDVHHGSPSEFSGLKAHSDYLLGTNRIAFKSYDSLDQFLTQHQNVEGRLLVFNRDTFNVREVIIKPNTNWGGAGSLGSDVGVGMLHQLPLDGKREVRYEPEIGLEQGGNNSAPAGVQLCVSAVASPTAPMTAPVVDRVLLPSSGQQQQQQPNWSTHQPQQPQYSQFPQQPPQPQYLPPVYPPTASAAFPSPLPAQLNQPQPVSHPQPTMPTQLPQPTMPSYQAAPPSSSTYPGQANNFQQYYPQTTFPQQYQAPPTIASAPQQQQQQQPYQSRPAPPSSFSPSQPPPAYTSPPVGSRALYTQPPMPTPAMPTIAATSSSGLP